MGNYVIVYYELAEPRPQKPWVHSSVARAADCRSAGPWLKSGCALLLMIFTSLYSHMFCGVIMCELNTMKICVGTARSKNAKSNAAPASDCRSSGPWLKSGCTLVSMTFTTIDGKLSEQKSGHPESNQGQSDSCIYLQSDALPAELRPAYLI